MNPEEKKKEFMKEYEELCKKHNLQIFAAPRYILNPDGKGFSTVINLFVEKPLSQIITPGNNLKPVN